MTEPIITPKDIERFWSKVDKRDPDECWPWLATRRKPSGHGKFKIWQRTIEAHRIAYMLSYGSIPDGLVVRHICNFPPCCNPAHLTIGTRADNSRDRVETCLKDESYQEQPKPIHPLPDARPWAKWHGRKPTAEERFWDKVDKRGPDECWLWTASYFDSGYGVFNFRGRQAGRAHVFSYLIHKGPLPEDKPLVGHICNNRKCVNPAHLYACNSAENSRYMAECGRSLKGDKNGAHIHIDRVLRGDNHPAHLHPETRQGEANGHAKLTEDDVRSIRSLYATGNFLQKELAQKFGVHQGMISAVVLRKFWAHVI